MFWFFFFVFLFVGFEGDVFNMVSSSVVSMRTVRRSYGYIWVIWIIEFRMKMFDRLCFLGGAMEGEIYLTVK